LQGLLRKVASLPPRKAWALWNKKKLAALKRPRRNLRWGESSRIANELRGLLQDLKAWVHDPDKGVALMASFYETDKGGPWAYVMIPAGISVISIAMMQWNSLWNMPHVAMKKKKLLI